MPTTNSTRQSAFVFTALLLAVSMLAALLASFTQLSTARAAQAATYVYGPIVTDTTWDLAGSPYIMTDTVTINPGITLTVEAGVVVMGEANTSLLIEGYLQAIGTPTNSITFTSALDSGPSQWEGLQIVGNSANAGAHLVYATIRYAHNALDVQNPLSNNTVLLEHSLFHANGNYAIIASTHTIDNLIMADVTFDNNTFDRVSIYAEPDEQLQADTLLTAQPGLEGYELADSLHLIIPSGISLTLAAGSTLLSPDYNTLSVLGNLLVAGAVTTTTTISGFEYITAGASGSVKMDFALVHGAEPSTYPTEGLGIASNSLALIELKNSAFINHEIPIVAEAEAIHRLQMDNVEFINNSSNRVTIIGGDLSDDITLTAQPGLEGYEVSDYNTNLQIPQGISLTVAAGASLLSPGYNIMLIQGKLIAAGTITATATISGFEYTFASATGSVKMDHALVYGAEPSTYPTEGLGIPSNSSQLIELNNTTFTNHEIPIVADAEALHRLRMDNVEFVNNSSNRVTIIGGSLSDDVVLTSQPGLEGYEVQSLSSPFFTIPDGVTLTMAAGANLFSSYYDFIDVQGNLVAEGEISATTLISGFELIVVSDTGSIHMNHAVLYGGVTASQNLGLAILGASSTNEIDLQDTVLTNHDWPIVVSPEALHRLKMDNVTFSNNDVNHVFIDAPSSGNNPLTADVILTPQPGLEAYEMLDDDLVVPSGVTLTLAGGTTLLSPAHQVLEISGNLEVKGTITATAIISGFGMVSIDPPSGKATINNALIYGAVPTVPSVGLAISGNSLDSVELHNVSLVNHESPISIDANALHRLQMDNVTFSNNNSNRVTIIGGSLSDDVVLTPQPGLEGYELSDFSLPELVIPQGITLTLAAGTSLLTTLGDYSYLSVNGKLLVAGEVTASTIISGFLAIGVGASGSIYMDHALVYGKAPNLASWGIVFEGNSTQPIELKNSTFTHHDYPVVAEADALHRLQMDNLTFTNNNSNRVKILKDSLASNVTLTPQSGLEGYEIAVDNSGEFFIPQGITLTLAAGASLLTIDYHDISVQGKLLVEGTITATATISGFNYLLAQASGSIYMNHALVYGKALSTGSYAVAIMGTSSQPVELKNSIFAYHSYPIVVDAGALHRLQMDNITFINNDLNRVIISTEFGSSLTADAILTSQPGLESYEVLDDDLVVPTGITLTLASGTTLMVSEDHQLQVDGRLQSNGLPTQPVTITSSLDSAPGQWAGIYFGSGEGYLSNTTIRYGESNITLGSPAAALYMTKTQLIEGVVGLTVQEGTVTAVCSTFANQTADSVRVNSSGNPDVTIYSSNIFNNAGWGLLNESGIQVNAINNWWGDASGPGGAGPGSGDEISGTIAFDPWLTTPLCQTNGTADLALTMTASPSTVLAGAMITYTLTINNNGPSSASDVVVTNPLPPNTTLVGVPPVGCVGTSTLTCALGNLPLGANQVISYQVSVAETVSGTITNTASVSTISIDLNSANNQDTVTNTVLALPQFNFMPPTYSQSEAQTTAVLTVTSNMPVAMTTTVMYATQDNTAVAGSDYLAATGVLTFTPGSSSANISLTILDDALFEPDESLTVTLSAPNNAILGADSSATFTILNDDAPQADVSVSVSATPTIVLAGQTLTYSLAVHNAGPQIASTVQLTHTLPPEVTLVALPPNCTGTTTLVCDLGTMPISGEAVLSYAVSVPITATGSITTSALVAAAEEDNVPSNNTAVLVTPIQAMPQVYFQQSEYSASEASSPALITVTLSASPPITGSVYYTMTPITAVPGQDYLPAEGTLTFTPGMTTAVISVTLLDDSQVEPDETFQLNLTSPQNLHLGSPSSVTFTILDDDALVADLAVNLAASATSVLTGDHLTYTLTVHNNGPQLATAVSLTNTLPTAATLLTTLPNCTGTSTLLCTWPTLAPNSSYTLTYQVSLDGLLSGTITNSVAVTAVTPDTHPSNNEASVTTAVFAPQLAFAASALSVDEGLETAVLSLTLDFAPATTVTVHYLTTGGSATPGADYEPISGTLTFAPGVTVQTIIIPLIEDNQVEDAETFSIRLESATNAILTEETAVVTIRDNDQQPTLYLPLIRKP